MDRGIPTEATLKEMREAGTQYLVGTPKSMLSKLDQQFADKPWQQVHGRAARNRHALQT